MKLYEFVSKLDYGFLVGAARLPRPIALLCCFLRALFRFSFNLEWRSYALSHRYVRQATDSCYRTLQSGPETMFASLQRMAWVFGRFWVESVEEFDVVRLARLGLRAGDCFVTWREACASESLRDSNDLTLQPPSKHSGIVLLTAHLESLYIPLCHLATQGRPIYLAATQIIESPQLPVSIGEHFKLKKQVLERHLGRDHVVYVEHGMYRLARALRDGAIVVIACDSPSPQGSRGIEVSFLGKHVLMAEGPRWLAMMARAQLALMTVKRFGFWHYDLQISIYRESENRVLDADALSVDASIDAAYRDLTEVIMEAPWRWWAADLATQYREPT